MDEILKNLSEHTGISVETAQKALGAIIAFLKEHLPEGLSAQLMNALPDAHGLVSAHEASEPAVADAGLMGALTGLATKFLGEGAGEAAKLVGKLQGSGLDLTQIESFLPKVIELIKAHIPAELYEKIVAMMPGAVAEAK